MKPSQFFLPFLNTSFGLSKPGRETKAVYSAWDGEGTIILLFRYDDEEPVSKLYSELADRKFSGALPDWKVTIAPDEAMERVDVYHIAADGHVCGPSDANPFLHWSVDGLLDRWLNLSVNDFSHIPPHDMGRNVIELDLPFVNGHRYARVYMLVKEGPRTRSEEEPRYQFCYTPPEELPSEDFLTAGILKTPPSYGSNSNLPSPLTGFFPFGASGDDMRAQYRMRQLAKKSVTEYEEAYYEVQREAGPYISVGHTTMESSWFWPTLLKHGEDAIQCQATGFGFPRTTSLEELQRLDSFKGFLKKRVPTRRIWGTLGLFWTLFLDQLDSRQSFAKCERCGRIIVGRRSKKFCSLEDSPECYRSRRALDRRTERMRAE